MPLLLVIVCLIIMKIEYNIFILTTSISVQFLKKLFIGILSYKLSLTLSAWSKYFNIRKY